MIRLLIVIVFNVISTLRCGLQNANIFHLLCKNLAISFFYLLSSCVLWSGFFLLKCCFLLPATSSCSEKTRFLTTSNLIKLRFGFPIQVIFSLRRKQVHLIPVLARPLVQKRSRHMMLVKYEQQFPIFVCMNCHFPFCNVKSHHRRLNRCFSKGGFMWVAKLTYRSPKPDF